MKVQGYDKLLEKGVSPKVKAFIDFLIMICNSDKRFDNYTLIIIEVLRRIEKQKEYLRLGKTKTLNSKHLLGLAVDIVFSQNGVCLWNDRELWAFLYSKFLVFLGKGCYKGRWGGDWNGNGLSSDEKFLDCPHFEFSE